MPEQNNADQEQDLREPMEREARCKHSGVTSAVVRGLGSLIPGLDTILEGLEESDAFQERLAAINERLEGQLREAPLKEINRGESEPGLQRRSSMSVRTLTPHRKPICIPRGGVRGSEQKPPQREPLVDVFDEGDHLLIIAELPGVEEKDVRVRLRDDRLTLSINSPDHEYRKEVTLPCPAEGEIDRLHKNGILQVRLRKR